MAEPFVGEIRSFSFGTVPHGWAPCNGQLLQITQNQVLYSLLGTLYGGDGKTTFALPNLQGCVPLCRGSSATLASVGGEESHPLTINEMPIHTHQAAAGPDATSPNPSGATWGTSDLTSYDATSNATMSSGALATAGGSEAHPNMQPYLALNYCIAIVGIYPPKP